jgi:hypothetical protein
LRVNLPRKKAFQPNVAQELLQAVIELHGVALDRILELAPDLYRYFKINCM